MGVGLSIFGGYLIGYAQGIQSLVTYAQNVIYQTYPTMPDVPGIVADTLAGDIQQTANPAYGSYWIFGIILAFLGFVLLARANRRPAIVQDQAPIIPASSEPPL